VLNGWKGREKMSDDSDRDEYLLPEDFGFDEWGGFSEPDDEPGPLDILPPPPAKPPRPVAYLTTHAQWCQRREWGTYMGRQALKRVGGEYLTYSAVAVYSDDTWDVLLWASDPREVLAEVYRLSAQHQLPIRNGGAAAISPAMVRIVEILGAPPKPGGSAPGCGKFGSTDAG
jgi:hypothetical protein